MLILKLINKKLVLSLEFSRIRNFCLSLIANSIATLFALCTCLVLPKFISLCNYAFAITLALHKDIVKLVLL